MHLVDNRSSSWLLYSLFLHRVSETQPGRNICLRFQFLAYSYYYVRSYQPCFVVINRFFQEYSPEGCDLANLHR